jgi:esterase/lipase
VTKFVGKFRKNSNYNDDYEYQSYKHTRRNDHSEMKKMIAQAEASNREIYEDIEILISQDDKD